MRSLSRGRSPLKNVMPISRVLGLLALFLLASCAGKKVPSTGGQAPPVVKETTGTSPARQASDGLLEEGKGFLEQGQLDRSMDSFKEAVGLDPGNGAGFYYLALVHFKLGEYEEARSILEKARSLLEGQEEWATPLEDLTRDLVR